MVNRMNRLLGCSLATGLQGKNEDLNKTTHLVLSQLPDTISSLPSARWLIAVSDYICMQSDRLVARADRMSVEKSALRDLAAETGSLP